MNLKGGGSKFVPNVSDPLITAFEKLVLRDIQQLESTEQRIWNNLPWQERRALQNLANDSSIVIKEADKGGGIVLLDRESYLTEVNRQLGSPVYYREIDADPMKHVQTVIKTVLVEGVNLGYISEELANLLTVKSPRTPIFYVLPKIHKPGFPQRVAQ